MKVSIDTEDQSTNPSSSTPIQDIIHSRLDRRGFLKQAMVLSAATTVAPMAGWAKPLANPSPENANENFIFEGLEHGVDEYHHVANGYQADVLVSWGDPLYSNSPQFDPYKQTPESQALQFGYNNDFIGYFPIDKNSTNNERALLVVNHEYTIATLMFPDVSDKQPLTKTQVDIEMAAHGASVIEVEKNQTGQWGVVIDSPFNRRITAGSTEMLLSGPVAGSDRVKTKADPSGTKVIGTFNNCAGGATPWGTVLIAEENFNGYFVGDAEQHPEKELLKRYGAPAAWYQWGNHHDRFDVNKEPNEINRFGWIVEIDPYDPKSTPIKRTALGRFKHEGAQSIVNKDGRVVVYSGDDQRFEYLYKYVSNEVYRPGDSTHNKQLLDNGVLYVAQFDDNGTIKWLPLEWGKGPLTKENGFDTQADVLIETRRAADLLGATPMDRPEDVEPNPVTDKVYVMLTNNSKREASNTDAANSRGPNLFGHIIEINPINKDHAAVMSQWEVLVQCGNPEDKTQQTQWNHVTGKHNWFASPDNCAVDNQGRVWIATDQGAAWPKSGTADGLWSLETEGPRRGLAKMIFRVPVGAELCGPAFTPDDSAVFAAVQHPSADGTEHYKPFGRKSTFSDPATRWPNFDKKLPPRPSVVVIQKKDGGKIAT